MKKLLFLVLVGLSFSAKAQPLSKHDLAFAKLPDKWDEAIPLGNGNIGALIWQKADRLRFSLDRADIWDMRPMKGLHRPEFSYQWVKGQVDKNDYKPVQQYFDWPYDAEPAPSKIPAGALEFNIPGNINVTGSRLSLKDAVCEVTWDNGMALKTFVHALHPIGWFRFENAPLNLEPALLPPAYQDKSLSSEEVNSLTGDNLGRLGYKAGNISRSKSSITYKQEGWGGFIYYISVTWRRTSAKVLEGVWSISSHYPDTKMQLKAESFANEAMKSSYLNDIKSHVRWWADFWSKSSLSVPDALLEKQWYLEQYKFGATARADAPPISLQAVWTADNGKIPPWKGDFHHDLNTQLSYWPAYSGNHLDEAIGYLNHLDQNKANYKRYTKQYFGVDGLAVPGVTTLDGTEMGGWIQYSLSPTVSSWLAQHYYLQWRYSMDRVFLKERAYPWFKDVCGFLEQITVIGENGLRKLPISSSPEINDNSVTAWFKDNTNYDLALMKYSLQIASELATELQLDNEARHWKELLAQFGEFSQTANHELMFAPTLPYNVSHRHFSHLMAIHPLGLIKWEDGEEAQRTIRSTLDLLYKIGPDYWCGYSYSWLGNIEARAKNGKKAAEALTTFARAFCLPNSFHANGDQTNSGLSKFTYRPFTLEGNFAFASGLQEMLLQSYAGHIDIFPAIPDHWKNVSFDNLRAEGAFLVSASRKNGMTTEITVHSEKGGRTWIKIPFDKWQIISSSKIKTDRTNDGFLSIDSREGGKLVLRAKAL